MTRQLEGVLPGGALARVTITGAVIGGIEVLSARAAESDAPRILPGLVDLQVNGYAGFDVNADDVAVAEIAALTHALREAGTTTYFPTVVTASEEKILHALATIADAAGGDPELAHAIGGIHVEGPALSEVDGPRGAHDTSQLRDPDVAELERWISASRGLLRIVTLAPERAGSREYIERARRAGVMISIGHTDATPEQIHDAADAGAVLSTHLGNGIQPVLPRHPNQLWAQLADDRLTAGIIADGQHVPADAFTAMVRAKGRGRSFIVSDSAALAGSKPGTYSSPVGGSVTVTASGRLELAGTGLLAGSGASLADCLRWATRETGIPPLDVLAMCTEVPAGLAGLEGRGSLRVGGSADLVVVDEHLDVQRVIVAGADVSARGR